MSQDFAISTFQQVVDKLESLSIMPKEMPGIEKIKQAFASTNWFSKIDPEKVIVVAGTNGKGSTCAILESLLLAARKNVGFYSSPHLIDTTERIRTNRKQISKEKFVQLYQQNVLLIEKFQLTHFEALTLMAADYFFSSVWDNQLDYAILEVGLGGTFDATNAIPHSISVITALSLDHTQILGPDLKSIAKNKFGIIQKNNLVIHHALAEELDDLKNDIQLKTQSTWYEAAPVTLAIEVNRNLFEIPKYFLKSKWGVSELNLIGNRAAENASTALTVFEKLGFQPENHLSALNTIDWQCRMQKVKWPKMKAAFYLSGDHNTAGVKSLLVLLKDFNWEKIHLIVGIGKDKDAFEMLELFSELKNIQLYLTQTPFKGLTIDQYPEPFRSKAVASNNNVEFLLNSIIPKVSEKDLVLVTGSLYLVGQVLKKISTHE